jgi:hypothetical protein
VLIFEKESNQLPLIEKGEIYLLSLTNQPLSILFSKDNKSLLIRNDLVKENKNNILNQAEEVYLDKCLYSNTAKQLYIISYKGKQNSELRDVYISTYEENGNLIKKTNDYDFFYKILADVKSNRLIFRSNTEIIILDYKLKNIGNVSFNGKINDYLFTYDYKYVVIYEYGYNETIKKAFIRPWIIDLNGKIIFKGNEEYEPKIIKYQIMGNDYFIDIKSIDYKED